MRRIKLRYVVMFIVGAVLFMNYVMPMVPGLNTLGARYMIVASTSMIPFLNMGDIVATTGVSPTDIKVGDVITFNVAPRFQEQYNYPSVVTHRVVEVINVGSDIYFQTKGDATEKDPFTVPASDVAGLYSWKIPYVGIPILFTRTVYGMALLASYIAMDVAFDYGPSWWKKRQEKEKLMTTVLQETTGVRQAIENLSSSMTKVTAPGAGILLKRNGSGKAELIEAHQSAGQTVRRRAE